MEYVHGNVLENSPQDNKLIFFIRLCLYIDSIKIVCSFFKSKLLKFAHVSQKKERDCHTDFFKKGILHYSSIL